MKRYFVDTNIFLNALIDRDSSHQDCLNFLKSTKSNKIHSASSHIVLAEISWTLKTYYQLPKIQIVRTLASIIKIRGIRWTNAFDANIATNLYQNHSVKFIDCLIASIPQIQSQEWTIVSYDKDFDKLKLPRLEPHKIS